MSGAGILRVYVVRHGETAWNRIQRLQGLVDVPLTGRGLRQARRCAGSLAGARLTHIAASPMRRALATAAELHHGRSCAVGVDARLREIDHGRWTALTIAEVAARWPDAVGPQGLRSACTPLARGESLLAAYVRVATFLAAVLRTHSRGAIAIVGHGVTNALLVAAAAGQDPNRLEDLLQPNASAVELTFVRRVLLDLRPVRAAVGA